MFNYIYNFYIWYYYIEVKCSNCGNKLFMNKKNYNPEFNKNNYVCNMACAYGTLNKK